MKNETKNCKNCQKDFTIDSEDFNFYERIKVPAPAWCPECRQQRRYAWRNERVLYRRDCDLCKKSTVTIYSPNKPCKVYCNDCWWGDGWDSASYGRDFDFSRPFFEQFHELQLEAPRMALLNKNSVNSDYTNHSSDNKNVYLSFSCFYDEDVMYSCLIWESRDVADCNYIYSKSERLYEVIDSHKSYRCQYGFVLRDCSSCYYCYDCRGCSDCFMSYNLRNKSYVFKNVQCSREEYLRKIKDYNLSSFEVREDLQKEFLKMMKDLAIHRYVVSERTVNSSGNMIFDCKNVKNAFDASEVENSRYMICTPDVVKDSMDIYHAGDNMELGYECHGCSRVSNCHFIHLSYDNFNLDYCDTCHNSQNLFGCMSVKKGEYMILNKKYSKEDYLALKEKIIEYMKSTGEYGEFFPPQFAPVYYNETQGNLYMPMSKEDVLARGWKWEDNVPGTFSKETISAKDIPDKIEDVPDSFLNEIFACVECSKNYNIVPNELSFYRKENLPLPRKCPDCRYKARFHIRLPRKLYHRSCMCEQENHDHDSKKCPNEFETPYSLDRSEKVYCESCYNKEVY